MRETPVPFPTDSIFYSVENIFFDSQAFDNYDLARPPPPPPAKPGPLPPPSAGVCLLASKVFSGDDVHRKIA